METVRIPTSQLVLRNLRTADLPDVAAYRCDPAVFRYIGAPMDPQDVAAHIARHGAGWSRRDGEALYLAVEDSRSRTVIGEVMLRDLDTRHRRAEIGIALAQAWQRTGYGIEALGGLFGYAFVDVGLHRLVAYSDVDNPATAPSIRHLGLRIEGRLRDNVYRHGQWHDEYVMALLSDEWRSRQHP